jgi:hypothetical protein
MKATDDILLTQAFNRLKKRLPFCRLDLDWEIVLALIGTLQLALRHPRFPATTRLTIRSMIDSVIRRTEESEPALGRLLRKGDDPACDSPVDNAIPFQITMWPTQELVTLSSEDLARVWKGHTPKGVEVRVLVAALASREGADDSELASALESVSNPLVDQKPLM